MTSFEMLIVVACVFCCCFAARTPVAAVLPHVKVSYVPLPPIPCCSNVNTSNTSKKGRYADDHTMVVATRNSCPENCTGICRTSTTGEDHHFAEKQSHHHHHHQDGHDNDHDGDWPFSGLPPAARVFGALEGQLSNRRRAQRKEDQLRCMLRCIFALLPSSLSSPSSSSSSSFTKTIATTRTTTTATDDSMMSRYQQQQQQQQPQLIPENVEHEDQESTTLRPFTIVDFGGGSGHLAIPLALLLQQRQQQEQQVDSFTLSATSTARPPPLPISYRVIVVDLGKRSLDLLHKKASHCAAAAAADGGGGSANDNAGDSSRCVEHLAMHEDKNVDNDEDARRCRLQPCHGIPNLFTFYGPVEEFNDIPFDMGVALHLCGEATDVAIRKCFHNNNNKNNNKAADTAPASLVFCPCCVGKLNAQRKNPYVWQATGTNMPTISYPQSKLFQRYISTKENWNALAQAADYSSHSCSSSNDTATILHESRTHSNAIRRTAKALVETDRLLFLREQTTAANNTATYETVLTRMIPWEATPKNDIIMAWPGTRTTTTRERGSELNTRATIARQPWMDATDRECESDIQQTRNLLVASIHPSDNANRHSYATTNVNGADATFMVQDSIYWTAQEEIEIRNRLQDYFLNHHYDKDDDHDQHERKILIFPTGMGRRKRKLVHHVAESLNLAHWCEGRKAADKTVAVAIRRTPPTPPPPQPLLPQQEKAKAKEQAIS
jgi:Methyltransferase TRM13